jgi:general secretion pathway protein D
VPPEAAPSKAATARQASDAQLARQGPAASTAGQEPAVVNLDQVALPVFIQVIYAEVLKRNVSLDPAVQSRKELVSFRTGGQQTAAQLAEAVQLLLKTYGLAVIDAGGLVRVVPDNARLGSLPEMRRGAADPDVPIPLRPVFQLVQLQTVRQTDVLSWLRTMFGDRIQAQEDASRNAVVLSGTPDNVKAALEAVRVLDQPVMAGRRSLALTPVYWSADDLARRLAEVLTAQGYAVAPVGQPLAAIRYPVVLLPVVSLNAVYVFALSDDVLNHVAAWARTLDKPNERGIGKNFFTYQVKHKDAGTLAKTLEQLLTGRGAARSTPTPGAGATPASRSTSVVVDQSTNTLLFQADPDEYSQLTALLQTLDRPAKGALIEVTVAELSVGDDSQFGVEWLLSDERSDGRTVTGGTLGGLSLGTAGLNVTVLNSAAAVRLKLNALASSNRATILSSPRVLARNGETATIQVGQEVPIITSQQTTNSTTTTSGGTLATGILQTVQYRSTGVILKVKPVIHSGDQVDLDVQQEVSAAAATNTGVNNSPTISTRKIDTKLTLKNGSTVLMGGLISDESTKGNAGIPFLKDVPVLGNLFSNQTGTGRRRELVVLITPYILNDQHDAEALTDSFRKMLGPWAGTVVRESPPAVTAAPVQPAAPPVTTTEPLPVPPKPQ